VAEPIRWGVLGASRFALNQMAPAIHAAAGGTLHALATRDPARAADFKRINPSLVCHADYAALLADADIDAVYIPLPNHLHVEWSVKAAEAGKHVLCEKPVAMHADEIDRLIELRERSGLVIGEAFMILHHPQWHYARELVQGGAIGRLMQVDSVFTFNNPDPDNIRNRVETGGGSLRDIGVYTIGSARYVSGAEPGEIRLDYLERENGIDSRAHVTAEFDGFHFSSVTSMRMAPRQYVAFHGDAGVIQLNSPFNASVYGEARVELHTPDFEIRQRRYPSVNQYVLQVEAFNRSAVEGAEFAGTLEFARGTQQTIDRIYQLVE